MRPWTHDIDQADRRPACLPGASLVPLCLGLRELIIIDKQTLKNLDKAVDDKVVVHLSPANIAYALP